ncbi:hypothetical protein PM082_017220 [Marasmius tenuissimus]|nr:hypothetical protein PM082_017220 [Marasmius tenuissimus]
MSALLLESFPAPPSFIPPTPRSPTPNHSNPNPPPSRPPSAPLPPVPGPSRISESDTQLFLGSSRNSKYSSASRPDSIASVASARSNGANYSHSPNNRNGKRDSSSSSISSGSRFASSMSGRPSPAHSVIKESYFEEDGVDVFNPSEAYGGTMSSDEEIGHSHEQLTKLRLSPMPPDNEHDHDSDHHHSPPLSACFPAPPPLSAKDQGTLANKRISLASSISSASHSSKRPFIHKEPSSHKVVNSIESGDSISAISMHDLLLDDDSGSEGEFDVPTTTNYPKPPTIKRPPMKLGSRKQIIPKAPIQTSGLTLSPTAPAISHTPPTPQSPAFGVPPPANASLPPSLTRLRSSVPGTPISDATEVPTPPVSSPYVEVDSPTPPTPFSITTPEPPSTQSTLYQSPTSAESRASPPPEAAPVEFPTQVQFTGESNSPAEGDYVFTDDPLLLHRELRSARSRSASHKKRLNSSKPSTPVHSPPPELAEEDNVFQSKAAIPRPRSSSSVSASMSERVTGKRVATGPPPSSFKGRPSVSTRTSGDERSGSPDIEDLIDSTPRPRRRSSASALSARGSVSSLGSNRSRSVSRVRKSRRSTGTSTTQSRRHASEGYSIDSREARIARLERELDGFGSDNSEGRPGERERGGYELEVSNSWTATGDNLLMEEDDGSASDSSLDIHTPLPHLLLRDGVLSHKSKLLPSSSFGTSDSTESLSNSQEDEERPGTTMSLRSVDSKASLLKDTRDTPVRRLRHKDGKLLRGGLGLTTGLGWSDSEDEDAPSPLTRQVSSLIGSRRSSFASLGNGRPSSSASHLSGSKSYSNLRSSSYSRTGSTPYTPRMSSSLSRSHSASTLLEADEFGVMEDDGYASTTYHGYPASRTSAMGSSPPTSWHRGSRFTSRRDKGSSEPLAVSIPERVPSTPRSNTSKGIARSASESSMRTSETDEILKTPSTSFSVSSLSIPPEKQMDDDVPLTPSSMRVYQDKILPPLPNPKTGSIRRPAAPGLGARFDSPNRSGLRSRSNSGFSSSTSSPAVSDAPPLPLHASSSIRSLKQLQLPRYSAGASQKPVPVPRVTSPVSPTMPSTGFPKPRTGTGMVYKKSGTSSSPKTLSRIPSTPMLRSSSSSSGIRF